MGIEYTLYTEIYVKDKWYNVDSYVRTPAGKYKLSPLLSGKSYVRELLNKLDFDKRINFSDLADGTQKYLIAQTDEEYRGQLSSEMFEVYDYYAEVKPKLVRKNQYEYYVPRYAIAAYEVGEIEEITDWLPRDAYDELPPEERKDYVFYKWTEPDSWYKALAEVIERVEMRLVDYYRETDYCNDDFREYLQPTNPIRLILRTS